MSPARSNPPSGRARLNCRWEPFSLVVRELVPLLARQQEEVGKAYQDFDPDWGRYFEYERAGLLRIWTARDADGVLVGYFVGLLVHGLHAASTRHCYADLFWLAPEWRDGMLGLRFLRAAVEACRGLGVQVLRWEVNDTFAPDENGRSRVAKLLERIGFGQVGTVMQMRF